ncbi:cytochrome C assembly family protein [Caldimonas tepidiphila]|uniref:cytochrome C assembly family protein n=1 Tax=Caldimonas tepidiphila TaxID=2315841 RepID=UPI001F0BCC3B|nr:cytochrome c biogenesis protein CcsA [Caldimonas tepidiphila]
MPTVAASLVALAAYAAAVMRSDAGAQALRWALLVGWAAHGLAIVFDTAGIGVAAGTRFGFAPALSVTLWLVLAVYAVESRFVPLPGMRRVLAGCGAAAVLLMLLFPGELHPHRDGSGLAPLHWFLGIASYGLFGAAVLHAALLSNAERQMRLKRGAVAPKPLGLPLLSLEKLTFRFVAAGFAVLSAALLFGWWFASAWRWDHKTVFSVLGWGVFAALLIGRHAFGWRGRRATRWLYTGAALLLLAYVGSRFVIEVLLSHRSAAA